MTENVLVLMSTYNGEKYLRQQIDSIVGQQKVSVKLLVRDDGSSDSTLAILKEYKAKGLLDFYKGGNLGPARSFMHLLQNAPASDYYAFSDQDDVWLPEKLSVAINSLRGHEDKPALYFCQTQLVDENLNKKESVIIHPYLTFGEAIVYKFIGGCTMVVNHRLRFIIGKQQPSYMRMHDTWVYFIAQSMNAYIHFDETPHILYRQHSNNVLGQGQGWIHEWILRIKRFVSLKNDRFKQAYELMLCYGNTIPVENKALLVSFLDGKHGFLNRIRLISNKKLRCANATTQLLFWINVLLNKY